MNNHLARFCLLLLSLLVISEIATGVRGSISIFYGTGVDATNENGQTSLMLTARVGLMEALLSLLEQGADVNLKDNRGRTALHEVAETGCPEGANTLLKYGANVNARDNELNTPLHILCHGSSKDKVEIMKIFLTHGADVGARNKYGDTPLHVMLYPKMLEQKKWRDMAEMLLSNGAVMNTLNNDGWGSVAGWAHYYLDGPIKRLLEAKHVKIEKLPTRTTYILKEAQGGKPSLRLTPLHIASLMGEKTQVEFLLDNGADVNACGEEMMLTPLHFAAVTGLEDVLEMLLDRGAMVNARDKDGDTPLKLAIRCNRSKAALVLRNHGGEE